MDIDKLKSMFPAGKFSPRGEIERARFKHLQTVYREMLAAMPPLDEWLAASPRSELQEYTYRKLRSALEREAEHPSPRLIAFRKGRLVSVSWRADVGPEFLQ